MTYGFTHMGNFFLLLLLLLGSGPKGPMSCRIQGWISIRPSVRPPPKASLLNNMGNWWKMKKMWNSYWIIWQIDKKLKEMQNPYWISWKIAPKASNMPSQDVWKFTPVSYRTSALWGRCPALTPLLQLITPSRASGTADHVRSLDDLLDFILASRVHIVCVLKMRITNSSIQFNA